EGFVGIDSADSVWAQFALSLDVGLRPFRARVEYARELPGGAEHIYGAPAAGLYSAACGQIFNLLVSEETARRCENATCGRVFVHQLGGAVYGQYRSKGVRFCTPSCAKAETQRQYRRRKKGA
ncbi:MAG: hypothetical protein ACYDD6_05900, partial [Acidimicrobiales bacterium]